MTEAERVSQKHQLKPSQIGLTGLQSLDMVEDPRNVESAMVIIAKTMFCLDSFSLWKANNTSQRYLDNLAKTLSI